MKKINIILITIVYLAAIVLVSVFGLRTKLYKEIIPVESVVCYNETDIENNITVTNSNDKKIIRIPLNPDGDTELFLNCRALPDNATNRRLSYSYDTEKYKDVITPVKDDDGNYLGLFLFKRKVLFDMKIIATDGSEKSTTVKIWVY